MAKETELSPWFNLSRKEVSNFLFKRSVCVNLFSADSSTGESQFSFRFASLSFFSTSSTHLAWLLFFSDDSVWFPSAMFYYLFGGIKSFRFTRVCPDLICPGSFCPPTGLFFPHDRVVSPPCPGYYYYYYYYYYKYLVCVIQSVIHWVCFLIYYQRKETSKPCKVLCAFLAIQRK